MEARFSIERARLRQQVAREVIAWCRRMKASRFVPPRDDKERTAAALQLHDLHAQHARQLGDEEAAERADMRYDRELERRFGSHDGD